MLKQDFSKLSKLLRNIVSDPKKVYGLVIVFAFLIYSCFWLFWSYQAKHRVAELLQKKSNYLGKNISLSYDKITATGYPFAIKINVFNPSLKIDFAEIISSPYILDDFYNTYLEYEDFYNFSWDEEITLGKKIIISASMLDAEFNFTVKGPIHLTSNINSKIFKSIINYDEISANLNFSSNFFSETFSPFDSLEKFIARNANLSLKVSNLKSVADETNKFLYLIEEHNSSFNIRFTDKNFDKFELLTETNNKNSEHGNSYSEYVEELYNIHLVTYLSNKWGVYNPVIKPYPFLEGAGNTNLKLKIATSLNSLLEANRTILMVDLISYERQNDLLGKNISGTLKTHMKDNLGEIDLDTEIKTTINESWYNYTLKSRDFINKKLDYQKQELHKYISKYDQEEFSKDIFNILDNKAIFEHSHIINKKLQNLIPKLYQYGEIKLSTKFNNQYNDNLLYINDLNISFDSDKFSSNLTGNIKSDGFSNYYGDLSLVITNYNQLIDTAFATFENLAMIKDPAKIYQDKNIILTLLKNNFLVPEDSKIELTYHNSEENGMLIGRNSYPQFEEIFNKKIKPRLANYEIHNILLSAKDNESDELHRQKQKCYYAGKHEKWNEVKDSCAVLVKSDNHPEAQYYYAKMFLANSKSKANRDKAFILFKKSASLNYYPAYQYLAKSYEEGIGTTKDLALADKWYKKSYYVKATYKHALNIANFYNNQETPNLNKALSWYLVSYYHGNDSALDKVKEVLTKNHENKIEAEKMFYQAKEKAKIIINEYSSS